MFDKAAAVAEVEQAIDRLSRGLEPETIPASAAMGLVRTVARAERQLGGVKMRLAGRVAETPVWKHQGHRSPAHWLAGESRSSVAEAAGVLDTAAKLAELPATLGGLRDGALSRPQAAAIADAAAVAPGAEADLVALAARESLKGLRDEAARRKTAHLDEQARHAAILASRHVRFGVEPDGAATLSVRATADAVAEIRAGISHFQNQVFDQARRDGLRDRFEAYAVDGLVAMARSALGGGDAAAKRLPTKVVVRVDGTVLDRGHAREGDTCEVTGAGPVPASHVAELLATGEAFAAVVATDPAGRVTRVAHVGRRPVADTSVLVDALAARGRDVTVAHHSRPPDAYQRTALEWTTPICAVLGCDQPRQEIDHREDWARTHRTKLDELDGFCCHHHLLKTRYGWRLDPGTGRRPMRPPDEPRPPGHDPP